MTTSPVVASPKPRVRRVSKPEAKHLPVAPVPEVVEEPVEAVDETVVENEEPEVVVESIESQIQTVRNTINVLVKDLKDKLGEFKTLDQELKKISLSSKKHFKMKKPKKVSPKNSNFGFNAEVLISDELADFFNVPHGTKMRPPQAFSLFNNYAKENGCKEESNKTIFKCDKKMKKLVGEPVHLIKKGDASLGYGVSNFNITNYLSKHFTKLNTNSD
jgi:chromatin remodeling complex protein RSC6